MPQHRFFQYDHAGYKLVLLFVWCQCHFHVAYHELPSPHPLAYLKLHVF